MVSTNEKKALVCTHPSPLLFLSILSITLKLLFSSLPSYIAFFLLQESSNEEKKCSDHIRTWISPLISISMCFKCIFIYFQILFALWVFDILWASLVVNAGIKSLVEVWLRSLLKNFEVWFVISILATSIHEQRPRRPTD